MSWAGDVARWLIYFILGGREPEVSPPVTPEDVEEMEDLAQDYEVEEYEGEEGGEIWIRRTDEVKAIERDTEPIKQIRDDDPFWKRFLGL